MSQVLTTPVVTNVTIIGDPVPGSFLRGSYFYDGTSPEENSIYRWYVDDVSFLPSPSLDYEITHEHARAKITFSVTPVSTDGSMGIETYSLPLEVFDGYQNITEEEDRNSFMSQRGHYSVYGSDPKDRVFVGNAVAFSLTNGSSQSVNVRGRADFAGVPPAEIQQYLRNNPATRMFSTERDFGALVPVLGSTKRLLLWGNNMLNVPPTLDLNNIKYVYSNRAAVAFIYDNPPRGKNTIGAFGSPTLGGVVPVAIQSPLLFDPPMAIYATEYAFAVLTHEGRVYAWGNPTTGGTIPGNIADQLMYMKVERIVCTASAFCAIGPERFGDPEIKLVLTWGDANGGGNILAPEMETIIDQDGVDQVVANRNAFCAITKRRKRAVSWGYAPYGGTMGDSTKQFAARGNIMLCVGSAWAFCMVNSSGQSESWGAAGSGGGSLTDGKDEEDVDAAQLFEESGAKESIAALFNDMKIDDWYQQRMRSVPHKCECDPNTLPGRNLSEVVTPNGVISIHSNDSSFFLVAKEPDGRTKDLFAWGQATGGGAIPPNTRQVLMASLITGVYCTNGAYGVISTQGTTPGAVSAFGGGPAQQDAGVIPTALEDHLRRDVSSLYTMKTLPPFAPTASRSVSAFAARREDGNYVVWGGGGWVTDELFVPT